MQSTIHYKFRSGLESKIVHFEGQSVHVYHLAKLICAAESIKTDLFDLKLLNSKFIELDAKTRVPKNSAVVVQRVPKNNCKKMPKTARVEQFTSASAASACSVAHIKQIDFAKMSEAERIQHAMRQSTYKYAPSAYSRKPTTKGVAPENYQCQRCYQYGHFPQDCPLVGVRKTTGIIASDLVLTTASDPDCLLHTDGKWYVRKTVLQTREQKKLQIEQRKLGVANPINRHEQKSMEIPDELKCSICSELFREAVTLRCGDNFCGDCIQQKVIAASLADEQCPCPKCQQIVTINDLIPDQKLRKTVESFKFGRLSPELQQSCTSASSPSEACSKTPSPTPTLNSPEQPQTDVPLRIPTVNLCAVFQPKSFVPSPLVVNDGSPNSNTVLSNEIPQFDEGDKENIKEAWRCVKIFERSIEIAELFDASRDKKPKLVSENQPSTTHSRKRRRDNDSDITDKGIKRSRQHQKNNYY